MARRRCPNRHSVPNLSCFSRGFSNIFRLKQFGHQWLPGWSVVLRSYLGYFIRQPPSKRPQLERNIFTWCRGGPPTGIPLHPLNRNLCSLLRYGPFTSRHQFGKTAKEFTKLRSNNNLLTLCDSLLILRLAMSSWIRQGHPTSLPESSK